MSKLKRLLPLETLKLIYTSLVMCHFSYCITLWGHIPGRLVKLQKRALRIITNSKYNAHTMPLFKRLNLLTLNDIFKLQCMKFYHKYMNNQLPDFFRSYYVRDAPHTHNTRHTHLYVPNTRTEAARKRLRYFIPEILKKVPTSVTDKLLTHSLNGFANYYKNILLSEYETTCNIRNCRICRS